MFNTAPKRIGWFCLFCAVWLGGWFTIHILQPSLKAPHPTKPILKIHTGRFRSDQIAFSPDGTQLLCLYSQQSTGGNSIRRWNVQSGARLTPITSREALTMLSEDGRFYATEDKDNWKTKHFFQIKDQKLLSTIPFGGTGEGLVGIVGHQPLAISLKRKTNSDAKKSDDRTTNQYFIRNIRTKKLLTPNSVTHPPIKQVPWDPGTAFAQDGSKILSLYPVYTEDEKQKNLQLNNQFNGLPVKAIIPAVKIKTFDWLTGQQQTIPFPPKLNHPSSLLGENSYYQTPQLSDDGKLYAAVSFTVKGSNSANDQDGTIWCYDLIQKKLRWHYHHEKYFPLILRFSPDGTKVAAGGHDTDYRGNSGVVYVLDAKTGKLLHIFTEQTRKNQLIVGTLLTLDRLKYTLRDRINFYKKINWHLEQSYYNGLAPNDPGIPVALSWSSDSKTLATSFAFGDVKLWRVKE